MSQDESGSRASPEAERRGSDVRPEGRARFSHDRSAPTEKARRLFAEHTFLRDEEVLDAQQRVTDTASWAWAPDDDELVWSPNYFRLLGYEPGEAQPSREFFADHVHPLDRELVLDAAAEGRDVEYRVIRRDGATRFFRARQVAHLPATPGRPERYVGIVQDLTEARRSNVVIETHIAISEALAGWVSLDRDAEGLLARVSAALRCFRAGVWVPRGHVMVVAAYWDEEGAAEKDRILEMPVRYGEGVMGSAWQRREPICVSDYLADPQYAEHHDLVEAAAIRGLLALPLCAGDDIVALAGFASHDTLHLSGSDYLSLSVFSQRLGRFLAARTEELANPLLSPRERELLQLAAEGVSGSEIAARLHISRETVKSHFTHIYTKLGVSDRAAAVAVGMRRGLLS